jgi:hypothetical protein
MLTFLNLETTPDAQLSLLKGCREKSSYGLFAHRLLISRSSAIWQLALPRREIRLIVYQCFSYSLLLNTMFNEKANIMCNEF